MQQRWKGQVGILVLMIGVILPGFSQNRGNLTGKVVDQKGNTLPGASITVQGTTLGTATDLNGFYSLSGIPDGLQKVKVEYMGYLPVTKDVSVEKGTTREVDFKLTVTVKELKGATVSAVIDGQQRALNQQKNASNIVQVLSADQIGRFPDLNVAEALQRVSGVTITRERGEGAEVQLRGTPANFVNINVNGEQIMGVTGTNGNRNTTLDVIPSDIISSIEVQKTMLPSSDGDAIAGVVNLRTGIARSIKGKGSFDIGSGYNVLRQSAPLNFKAGYSKRFLATEKNPNGVWGVAANASFYKTYNGYDGLEAQSWLAKNIKDLKGNDIEALKGTYVPTDFRYRYQIGDRTRKGGTLAVDYAPNLNTRFVLSAMYNNRREDDTRYRSRYRYRGDFYDMGEGKVGTDRMQNVLQTTYSKVDINNLNINLDGESLLGTWKIDGGLFYSYSKKNAINGQYSFQTPDWRSNNKDITGTDNGNGKPIKIPVRTILAETAYSERYLSSTYVYQPSYGGAADDPSRFNFYEVANNDFIATGRNITGKFNVSKDYFLAKKYASVFSFGVKGKFMHNERYRPETATVLGISTITNASSADYGDTQLSKFLYKDNLSSSFLHGNLNFGPAADVDKIRNLIQSRPDRFVQNDYRTGANKETQYYLTNENILAGYLMNKTQLNKLTVIAGLRFEHTNVDYDANKVFRYNAAFDPKVNGGQDPASTTPVYNAYLSQKADSSLSYLKVLPNLQFKYDVGRNTIARLAWTTGYSRPNLVDLLPSVNLNTDNNKVEAGNPALQPAYSNNFDLSLEHYLKNVGIISGSFFYKHIDKFQYLSEGLVTDAKNPYYNADAEDQYTLTQPKNGKTANLYGIEVNFNTSLTFLPGFLRNLVFTSNYTYVYSRATTAENRSSLRLPGQADHSANVALSYSSKKLTIQSSLNYNGKFIYSLGSNSNEDIWNDARWQLDLNGTVAITKALSFYAAAVNVLNAPAFQYMGVTSRVYNLEYTATFTRAGFTYRF